MASENAVDGLFDQFRLLRHQDQLQLATLINWHLRVYANEGAAGPATEPASERAGGPATEPASKRAAGPSTEPASERAAGPATEPPSGSYAERQSQESNKGTPDAEHQPREHTKEMPPAAGSSKDYAPKKCYTVVRTNVDARHLLGIHYCYWAHLENRLPRGNLKGLGGHVRGLPTRDAALHYWHVQHPLLEPKFHTYDS